MLSTHQYPRMRGAVFRLYSGQTQLCAGGSEYRSPWCAHKGGREARWSKCNGVGAGASHYGCLQRWAGLEGPPGVAVGRLGLEGEGLCGWPSCGLRLKRDLGTMDQSTSQTTGQYMGEIK